MVKTLLVGLLLFIVARYAAGDCKPLAQCTNKIPCTGGRPTRMTFRFNGGNCSDTATTDMQATCNGNGTPKYGPDGSCAGGSFYFQIQNAKNDEYYASSVKLGEEFSVGNGADAIGSNLFVDIYTSSNKNTNLMSLQFSVSCAQQLNLGYVYGAIEVTGIDTENGVPVDCEFPDEDEDEDDCTTGSFPLLCRVASGVRAFVNFFLAPFLN